MQFLISLIIHIIYRLFSPNGALLNSKGFRPFSFPPKDENSIKQLWRGFVVSQLIIIGFMFNKVEAISVLLCD